MGTLKEYTRFAMQTQQFDKLVLHALHELFFTKLTISVPSEPRNLRE